jgi:hypothetical protein
MSTGARRDWKPPEAGGYIGSGKHRDVYHHCTDEALVVKVVHNLKRVACQIDEYETWRLAAGTRLEQFLCPIVWISECGQILHQKKAIGDPSFYPAQEWMGKDIKSGNWGVYEGRPVLVDYTGRIVLDLVRRELDHHSVRTADGR